MELKFDRFYYLVDNQNHFLSEIVSIDDSELDSKYKGKMYCPLCKKVQLSLSHGVKSTFLRTYPKQKHGLVDGDLCQYAYKEASSNTVNLYIDELRDRKKIKSLIGSVMRYLTGSKEKHILINRNGISSANPLIIEPSSKTKNKNRTVIPHYSFKSWGIMIPKDRLVIIYGKVKICINENADSNYAYLHFRTIDSDRFITSCLKPKNMDIQEGQYYTVLLGKRVDNKGFKNIELNKPEIESIMVMPLL